MSTVPGPVAICSFPRDDVPKSPRQCSYLAVMVFFRVRNLRLRFDTKDSNKEKAEKYFNEAGYTKEDYIIDLKNVAIKMEPIKPKNNITYRFTDTEDYTTKSALQIAGICDTINVAVFDKYYDLTIGGNTSSTI